LKNPPHEKKPQTTMRVAVIGGGPSGLVTLKYLKTAHEFFPGAEPIDAKLFEAESSVGGTFKHRAYENAEVSTPGKKKTNLSKKFDGPNNQ